MRKQVEESVATGAAAGRGRGGRFSAGRKREVVMDSVVRPEIVVARERVDQERRLCPVTYIIPFSWTLDCERVLAGGVSR